MQALRRNERYSVFQAVSNPLANGRLVGFLCFLLLGGSAKDAVDLKEEEDGVYQAGYLSPCYRQCSICCLLGILGHRSIGGALCMSAMLCSVYSVFGGLGAGFIAESIRRDIQ